MKVLVVIITVGLVVLLAISTLPLEILAISCLFIGVLGRLAYDSV